MLFKIARDKIFEQLMRLEKGKYRHRISEINKQHKEALKFEPLDAYEPLMAQLGQSHLQEMAASGTQ